MTFNLLERPWIRVKTLSGELLDVSIKDCFGRAHELSAVVGETPCQAASTVRLLIAILYRALPAARRRPGVEWQTWWDASALPIAQIQSYLTRYSDRFDLFHDAHPFMQVAELRNNKTSGLTKLIGDVPDGEQFFTVRSGRALETLSPAEAARWLIHCQAFDPSGIKTGAVGDPRVKGGKGYPIGTGWAGWCGLVLAEGRTLAETLLLNLDLQLDVSVDSTPWERSPHGVAPDADHPEPLGPADIMTWQSRRIALIQDVSGVVVNVVIANGDPIHPRNRHGVEPHCGWRFSGPQTKAHGVDVYMPRAHDPNRALWRGLPSLLPGQPPSVSKGPASAVAPNVMEWIASLVVNGHLDAAYPVRLWATGVTYGTQSSSFAAMVDDRMNLSAAVLAAPELRDTVRDAVGSAEGAVTALRHLAANLAVCVGVHETSGATERASALAYSVLDSAFPVWAASLTPGCDVSERAQAWQYFVRDAMDRLAAQLISDAGSLGWVGRVARRLDGTSQRLDASRASIYFRAALRKALPLAFPQDAPTLGHPATGEHLSDERGQLSLMEENDG